MQIIKELSEYIDEELRDAEKYAKLSLLYKDMYPQIAETFNRLSAEEMGHVDMLHNVGVNMINEYKAKGETVPEAMLMMYEYLHKQHIDKATQVKMYQKQYMGN